MKKKILIIFSIFLVVVGIFFVIQIHKKKQDFIFYKGKIIGEYEKQIPFVDRKKQEELKDFIVDLENINNEKDLFILLDSNIEGNPELNFETTKKQILTSLETEIKKKTDKKMQEKLAKQIQTLKNTTNSEIFFQELDKIYKTLNTFYYENTIVFVSEEDMKSYDFFNEKEKILEYLKKEIGKISDQEIKNNFNKQVKNLEKIEKDTIFFEELNKIYEKINIFYKKNGIEVPKQKDVEIKNFELK